MNDERKETGIGPDSLAQVTCNAQREMEELKEEVSVPGLRGSFLSHKLSKMVLRPYDQNLW